MSPFGDNHWMADGRKRVWWGLFNSETEEWYQEPDEHGEPARWLAPSRLKAVKKLVDLRPGYRTRIGYEPTRVVPENPPQYEQVFDVVSRRITTGEYELTYGQHPHKLRAFVRLTGPRQWVLDPPLSGRVRTSKTRAMAEFEDWARERYRKPHTPKVTPATPSAAASLLNARPLGGNPLPITAAARITHRHSKTDLTTDNPYGADPFNARFFDRAQLTPLGVLDEVYNYMVAELPFSCRIAYPWVNVTKVLRRAMPEFPKYKDTP